MLLYTGSAPFNIVSLYTVAISLELSVISILPANSLLPVKLLSDKVNATSQSVLTVIIPSGSSPLISKLGDITPSVIVYPVVISIFLIF